LRLPFSEQTAGPMPCNFYIPASNSKLGKNQPQRTQRNTKVKMKNVFLLPFLFPLRVLLSFVVFILFEFGIPVPLLPPLENPLHSGVFF
jgi:hypothetical protein